MKPYALRTEATYEQWIQRFIWFHGQRHPRGMGPVEVQALLSDLAVQGKVAASTQNQALNALVFLYPEVLGVELGDFSGFAGAQRPLRLPVVLTQFEVDALLTGLTGTFQLMGRLLYGAGMRFMECVRFGVKDVDFEQNQIVIRDGNGLKDRITRLPTRVKGDWDAHLARVRELHSQDVGGGNL